MRELQGSFLARVRALLGVEAGESRAVGLLVALYCLLATAFVFVQTSAYGLYIQEFGARNLPFAYLSIAAFASLLAYLYLRLSDRVSFRVLYLVDLGFLALVCALFWAGLQTGLKHWFIFLLPFWFQTIINLANLVVWPLAGRMFDVRQAKRLFGLVSSGNWLANILVGGLIVAPLLAFAGVANLYLFAAIAVFAAGLVLWLIFGGHLVPAAQHQDVTSTAAAKSSKRAAASPLKNPYSRLIFAYVLLWWLSFYVIDNIFYDLAGARYPDGAQLAAFIGKQLSVIGIIAIITSTFLTGRIVRRFGLRTSLLTMPVIVIVSTAVLVIGGVLGVPATVLFWVAAVGKTLNVALGFSLSFAAGTMLYQPILGNERNRIQTTAEGIVQPFAIGLAGALLLLFNTVLRFDAVGLSIVFLMIGALWLWVIVRLMKEYPRVLGEALLKRRLGETTTLLFDPAGIAQLRTGLKSPHASTVLYALNQLEQVEPQTWSATLRDSLPGLLAHPAPEVRGYVLQRIQSADFADVAPVVRERLSLEQNIQVRASAVQFLATYDDQAAQDIEDALRLPQPEVQQGAIIGLLSSAVPEKIDRACGLLNELVKSPKPEDRLTAAHALQRAACPSAKEYVTRLLQDEAPGIRQAAVRAAGYQDDRELLGAVAAACDQPETAPTAEQVLVSKGVNAVPVIEAVLSRTDRAMPSGGTISLLRVLGSIGGEHAIKLVESWIDCPDAEVRLRALLALRAAGYRMHSRSRLEEHLKRELAEAAWLIAGIESLASCPDLAVLSDALDADFQHARRCVLLLLSFGTDAQSMLRASKALDEAGGRSSAFAVEAVDASLPAAWKPLILPLMEDLSPAERLSRWQAAGVDAPVLSVELLVGELLEAGRSRRISRWTLLCAIHAAGARKVSSCKPALDALASHPDASVAGLSCWSLSRMGYAVPMQGEIAMLSLVEKVLALKAATLFGQTPDAVLADVAERVDEVSFGAGETIFEKGDRGDSLYIIVSGKVSVMDGERLLNELGEGANFGELALLEPAPRSATIQAIEPTHLLQLNESHFRIVLAERPEVAAAIIQVLTSYIRSLLAGNQTASATVPEILEA